MTATRPARHNGLSPPWPIRSVPHDFETLRIILLYLEERQVSPRSTVIIDLSNEAADLSLDSATFEDALNILLDLDYIEGPGADLDNLWLFRKLSRKGIAFVDAARDPADWAWMKQNRATVMPLP